MSIHSSNSGSSVGSGHVPGSGSKIMNIMDIDQPEADRWTGGQKLHIVSSQVEHLLTATRIQDSGHLFSTGHARGFVRLC